MRPDQARAPAAGLMCRAVVFGVSTELEEATAGCGQQGFRAGRDTQVDAGITPRAEGAGWVGSIGAAGGRPPGCPYGDAFRGTRGWAKAAGRARRPVGRGAEVAGPWDRRGEPLVGATAVLVVAGVWVRVAGAGPGGTG